MKIAIVTRIDNKNDLVKAYLNKRLLPKHFNHFWIFNEDKRFSLPNNVIPITFKNDNINIEILLEAFITLVEKYSFDCIVYLAGSTILYRSECLINPIKESNTDFCYFKNGEIIPTTNIACYSLSKKGVLYFKNTNLEDLKNMYKLNVHGIISHFLAYSNPWPLISQIDKSFIANNDHIEYINKTIIGNYNYMSNNDTLKHIIEVLNSQKKQVPNFFDKESDTYFKTI